MKSNKESQNIELNKTPTGVKISALRSQENIERTQICTKKISQSTIHATANLKEGRAGQEAKGGRRRGRAANAPLLVLLLLLLGRDLDRLRRRRHLRRLFRLLPLLPSPPLLRRNRNRSVGLHLGLCRLGRRQLAARLALARRTTVAAVLVAPTPLRLVWRRAKRGR